MNIPAHCPTLLHNAYIDAVETTPAGAAIEPWYKVGTANPSTANTDDSYLNARVVVGGTEIAIVHKNFDGETGNHNIAIGFNAMVADPEADGQISIANLIYATNATGGGSWDGQGNVGIGTKTPSVKFHIAGDGDNENKGRAFRLVDGNEGDGKVLMSDENGVGTWKAPGEFAPVLTKAIQEQQQMIEAQQVQIELLLKINEQLEARLKALETAK